MAFATSERLTGTHFNAELRSALAANFEIAESYMVGVSAWGLYFATLQEHVLVRDEQGPVVRNFGPSAAGHQFIMQWRALPLAFFLHQVDFFSRESPVKALHTF